MTTSTPPPFAFRDAYTRVVAALVRRFGGGRLEMVEDATQHALLMALEAWPRTAVPAAPVAWLTRVAHNRVIDELRRHARHDGGGQRNSEGDSESESESESETAVAADDAPADDVLRLLFAVCDDRVATDAQLVLALKLVCGFDVDEIASRLFLSEANVYKRLSRGRAELRAVVDEAFVVDADALVRRLPGVRAVLYVLFTDGHLANGTEASPVRRALCDEALRLARAIAISPLGGDATTAALVALFHFHLARMAARVDDDGGLLLLEEQERALFDAAHIADGCQWLAASARGDAVSRFHLEAGIAAEHCLAPSFAETRWDRIVSCYEQLEALTRSPLVRLNRALAMAAWRGPLAGLAIVDGAAPPTWLAGSHLWAAALCDLHRRAGHVDEAARHQASALASAPNDAIRALLARRFRS